MKRKPTTTYAEVIEQIEALKVQAEALRQAEVDEVIDRIKEAIAIYDLTAQDLGLSGALRGGGKTAAGKTPPGRRRGPKPKSTTPRFKDDAGNTWVGRGPRPGWLREALANGKTLKDFAV